MAPGEVVVGEFRFDIVGPDEKPDKQYRPCTYCSREDGRFDWQWQGLPKLWPLFDLPAVLSDPTKPILVVEGARKAETARELFPDFAATAALFGSKSPEHTDWAPLSGRTVVIWPDNDGPGAVFAAKVAALTVKAGATAVSIVEIPADWPKKWDLRDPLPDGVSDETLVEMLRSARPWAPDLAPIGAKSPSNDSGDTELACSQHTPIGVGDGAGRGKKRVSDQKPVLPDDVARLAALSLPEYEAQRLDAAKRLGWRASALDKIIELERAKSEITVGAAPQPGRKLSLRDPEPWPEAINGALLLDDITQEIKRYVILSENEASATALWVLAAHAFDSFVIYPRLFIRAAERGCGKTTTLEVITPLVPRPLNASSITAAAMYRVIEQARPTLLLDEADTFAKDDEDLRGVLNAGHRRDGVVLRCVEAREGYEVRQFSVWAPAALAAIGHLPATIEDRCIIISLRRKLPDEVVSSLRLDHVGHLERLAREAARWAADNADVLAAADPAIPDGIVNRQSDNWRPLIAVADLVGGRWPTQARNVATEMCRAGGGVKSIRELLLEDLRDLFDTEMPDESYGTRFSAELFAKKPNELFTDEILNALREREDRPWPEFRDGSPITSKQLAGLLRPLGVKVGRTVRRGGKTLKGYQREWLDDAFARYLAPTSVTPQEVTGDTSTSVTPQEV
jgi:hypothetical protein